MVIMLTTKKKNSSSGGWPYRAINHNLSYEGDVMYIYKYFNKLDGNIFKIKNLSLKDKK